jgi:hypothetical protein
MFKKKTVKTVKFYHLDKVSFTFKDIPTPRGGFCVYFATLKPNRNLAKLFFMQKRGLNALIKNTLGAEK